MSNESLIKYLSVTKKELTSVINNLNEKSLLLAADLIEKVVSNNGRVHVTGIGKPGHIATYVASLFSSIGTPTYFLDGTEAVHGSSGQVASGDVVIAISNSGETEELKKTILTLKNNGAHLIGVSGNEASWLSKNTDIFLFAGVKEEGDILNKPPRNSILAETIVLQSLSILLQETNQLDLQKYYEWHPGGALGASIKKLGEEEK